MISKTTEFGRVVAVRLNSGEDILQMLRQAVEQNGLRHALILNGAGSVDRYHYHVVETPEGKVQDVFFRGEGPFDIVSMSGMVLDGRVHAHISIGDQRGVIGGHLEEGTRILTFGVVVLAEVPELDLTGWDRIGTLD